MAAHPCLSEGGAWKERAHSREVGKETTSRQGPTLSPGLECSGVITVYCSLQLLVSSYPPTSASCGTRTTEMRSCMFPRLVLNSWSQVILLPWPPKVLGLQVSPHIQPTTSFLIPDNVSLCHPGWSTVTESGFTASSASQVQLILLPQSPE
ncbi:hypothetical protein AAY473_025658 [Plecturocebus cupreus]